MVTVDTELRTLNKLVGKELTIPELEELMFEIGMELDDVDEDKIKLDITAERPDMVSPQGVARVIRAYIGKENRTYVVHPGHKDYVVTVEESTKNIRPYTAAAIVKNLQFTKENIKQVMWVQEKLHDTFGRKRKKMAIGVYPLEKITLPITFKAEDPDKIRFIPLDMTKEMSSAEILEKHPKGRTYAHLMKGLKKHAVFRDAKEEVLSVPPIINSEKTGKITEKTKDIFVETSGFDLAAQEQALNILCHLFQDMGGDVYSMNIEYGEKHITTPDYTAEKRSVSTEYVKQVTGVEMTGKECAQYLERMMYYVLDVKDTSVEFTVPPIRTDIWHDIDIADDILRAYGINNIPIVLPPVATIGKILPENKLTALITEIMIGLHYHEVMTFILTSANDQYTKMNTKEKERIKLGHSEEQSINMVRTELLPETLKALVANRNKKFPQRIFEVNEVVVPDKNKDVLSRTELRMAALHSDTDATYTSIRQALEYVLDSVGVKDYSFKAREDPSYIKGRVAQVMIGEKELGIIGELSPQVLSNWDIESPTSGFEIKVEMLL